jgi:hypothetical protein
MLVTLLCAVSAHAAPQDFPGRVLVGVDFLGDGLARR